MPVHQIDTTHTGSLPRPPEIQPALLNRHRGDLSNDALLADLSKRAVAEVVRRQAEVGLSIVNDGEAGKYSFWSYLKDRVDGIEGVEVPYDSKSSRHLPGGERRSAQDFPEFFEHRRHADRFAREATTVVTPRCTGALKWKRFDLVERDISNLEAAMGDAGLDKHKGFMTSVSPGTAASLIGNDHYASSEEYLAALGEVLRQEYAAIVDAGFILQIDCPDLAVHLLDGEFAPDSERPLREYDPGQFRREVARNIEALNFATQALPPERMRIHVCWGSTEQPHHLDPELATIVDLLLTVWPAGLMVAAANGRHEFEWQVWQDIELPPGKYVVPGVIDSTTNIVEHPETVSDRLRRYAKVLGPENLVAGVDCGFQTAAGRDQVEPRVAWAKLRSLAEGARLASSRLAS